MHQQFPGIIGFDPRGFGGGVIKQILDKQIHPLDTMLCCTDNFVRWGGRQIFLQQAEIAGEGTKGIADFVGHARRQGTDAGQFSAAHEFVLCLLELGVGCLQ